MILNTGSWSEDTQDRSLQFFGKGGFPSLCGWVFGTIIPNDTPSEHEEQYVNRDGKHAIRL